MKSDKTFIVIMAIIVAVIIALAFYYFSSSSSSSLLKKESNNTINNTVSNQTGGTGNTGHGNSTTNNTINGGSSSDRISLSNVKDYDEFFTINSLINDYYQNMVDDDKSIVLDKIDAAYIKSHKITKNNVKNYMEQNYDDITYVSKYMYVKGLNSILYYFVNGEVQNYDFAAEVLTEKKGINYLIIVDQNNKTYSITPVASDISMFEYAQDYKMSNKTIEKNDNNKYKLQSINDQSIAIYYLNYFKNMLYLNTEKAYAMLDQNSKNAYDSYEAFVNNLSVLYDNLSTNLLSYSAKGEKGKRSYSIISTNQKQVNFIEKSIMDYTVTIVN